MMSIEELVAAAKRKKAESDKSVGWPLIVIRTIEGKGIRYKPDVNRLKKQMLESLRKEGLYCPRNRK